jgi:hypothetical protein
MLERASIFLAEDSPAVYTFSGKRSKPMGWTAISWYSMTPGGDVLLVGAEKDGPGPDIFVLD